jgi:hypothetical protein
MIFKVGFIQAPKQVEIKESRPEIGGEVLHKHPENINEPVYRKLVLPTEAQGARMGRNDPCPCGAINPMTNQVYKWKKCGMINAPHHK